MNRILVIAQNTFRETLRDKILNVIVVFAFLLIAGSILLGQLSVGQDLKIIKDLGLAVISLLGVAIAVFVGTSLVYKEIDKRTVFVVLTKPVPRHEFLLGKSLGLVMTLSVLWAAMSVAYLGLVAWQVHAVAWQLLVALAFIWLEWVVLTALSLFFSTFASPVLSMIYVLALYFVGHNSHTWKFLAQKAAPLTRLLLDGMYYLLPNLKTLDFKEQAVYALAIPHTQMLCGVVYGLAYTAVLLALATVVFSRREF